MAPTALIPIADGSEDIESVTLIDVLRRAEVEVTVASVMKQAVITCAHGTLITGDVLIASCMAETYDLIALPGGMPGAEHLRDNAHLTEMLKAQKEEKRYYAAICASPAVVLAHHKLIQNVQATCYPSFSTQIAYYNESAVVVDGMCITSQGPGTALPFALTLAAALVGKDAATEVGKKMLAAY